jgi:hypothetical protein
LLSSLKIIEEEILNLIEQGETDKARKKLKFEYSNFIYKMEKYEKKLTKIPSEFKYFDFKELMSEFFEEWPTNKSTLTKYLEKIQEKLTEKIEFKA